MVLKELHSSPTTGHFGFHKTYECIKNSFILILVKIKCNIMYHPSFKFLMGSSISPRSRPYSSSLPLDLSSSLFFSLSFYEVGFGVRAKEEIKVSLLSSSSSLFSKHKPTTSSRFYIFMQQLLSLNPQNPMGIAYIF